MPRGPRPRPGPVGMRALTSGGTSVAGDGRKRWVLATAAGVVTCALAVVIYLVVRGGDGDDATPAEEVEAEYVDEAEADRGPEPVTTTPGGSTPPAATDQRRPADAARNLAASLKRANQWATVTVDRVNPDMVIIRSSLCEEAGLQQVVSDAMGDLRAHGVITLRCVAPHGAVVFEQTP